MAVNYLCRHCGSKLGQIDSADIQEARLGFHFLTPEERRDIIAYDQNGDVTVKVTCDYCSQALEANPELALIHNPLQ